MTHKLLDKVIIQDLDTIPSKILSYFKLHLQKAITLSCVTSKRILSNLANSKYEKVRLAIKRRPLLYSLLPQILYKSRIQYQKDYSKLVSLSNYCDKRDE